MKDYGHIEFNQMFCLSPMSAFLNKITTKNVKPLPGIIPRAFLIPRHYAPGLYSVFHSGRKLSLISPGAFRWAHKCRGLYPRGLITGMKKHFGPF